MIPSLAAKRDRIADNCDPQKMHRMSPDSSSLAVSLAASYVVSAHEDSGLASETIMFLNRNGPLPPGHEWCFAVGGHVHKLPNERGKAALFFVAAEGVSHGTLPTSGFEPTFDHGNLGSALVTKASTVQAMKEQQRAFETTPVHLTASHIYQGCDELSDAALSAAMDNFEAKEPKKQKL